ncbi:hypothetical protein [Aeromonas bivalvium]|uniref:hypothetical protein n=1 Tax=Aeromonas bivalvium TaxID=440079 RepID=UPI003D236ADC
MRALLIILLLGLGALARAAEPEVRIQSRLVPADGVSVGGTLNLEVDLLVDTWFTAAPVLAPLQLAGAVVAPPSSEASHLTEQIDGKTFFGMRFTYRITPQLAQTFEIPPLQFQVQPGQGTGPVSLGSPALSFQARALPHGGKTPQLVANEVRFTQQIQRSHTPLRVGDSVQRQLRIEAEGAQAMLLPVPHFAAVKGLRRYVQTPSVMAMDDGRGTTTGGAREDKATYVIEQSGHFTLPPIRLTWWDAGSGQSRELTVPEVALSAAAGTYQAPFSISEDLHALGQQARITLAGKGVLLAGLGLMAVVLLWLGRPRLQALWHRLQTWRTHRRLAWLDSPDYALRLARTQLRQQPAELGGLYLWVRRRSGLLTIAPLLQTGPTSRLHPVLAFFRLNYGLDNKPSGEDATAGLAEKIVPALEGAMMETTERRPRPHALQPLNPGLDEPDHRRHTRRS